MKSNISILFSIVMGAVLAYMIGDFYGITPPIYLLIVLVALGLFIQTIIFILQYEDPEEADLHK